MPTKALSSVDFYEALAPYYDLVVPPEEDTLRRSRIRKMDAQIKICAKNSKSLHLLDLGCGFGSYALDFASLGYDVVGADSSSAMLAECRRRADSLGLRIELSKNDAAEALWWTENRYDAIVFCGNSLHHNPPNTHDPIFRSCLRALNPGGILFLNCRDYSRELGEPGVVQERADQKELFEEVDIVGLGRRRVQKLHFRNVEMVGDEVNVAFYSYEEIEADRKMFCVNLLQVNLLHGIGTSKILSWKTTVYYVMKDATIELLDRIGFADVQDASSDLGSSKSWYVTARRPPF